MSKVIIYDRKLRHSVVVNEDGSLNVQAQGQITSSDVKEAMTEALNSLNEVGLNVVLENVVVNDDGSLNVKIADIIDTADITKAIVDGLKDINVEGVEVVLDKLVIIDVQEGKEDATYIYPEGVNAIVISNDSRVRGRDFMFGINGIEMRLYAGETFEGEFEKFTQLEIANPHKAPYRIIIKKKVAGENVHDL